MTRKYAGGRRFCAGLAAVLGIVGLTVTSATATPKSWAYDNSDCEKRAAFAADGVISAKEAKSLTTLYLSQLGYESFGTSRFSARVMDVRADGDKWRVEFRYGSRLPSKTAVFFINKKSGLIGLTPIAALNGGSKK